MLACFESIPKALLVHFQPWFLDYCTDINSPMTIRRLLAGQVNAPQVAFSEESWHGSRPDNNLSLQYFRSLSFWIMEMTHHVMCTYCKYQSPLPKQHQVVQENFKTLRRSDEGCKPWKAGTITENTVLIFAKNVVEFFMVGRCRLKIWRGKRSMLMVVVHCQSTARWFASRSQHTSARNNHSWRLPQQMQSAFSYYHYSWAASWLLPARPRFLMPLHKLSSNLPRNLWLGLDEDWLIADPIWDKILGRQNLLS